MGIFKKIFKGVKKVFKKIGKSIKRAFKKVGKFMGKLGILGQIGLMFLLPGIGTLLGNTATFLGASSNALIQGAGKILQSAVNFGSKVGKVFSTVTDAVGGFVKEMGGTFLKKMGVSPEWLASKGLGTADTFAEGFRGWMDGVGQSIQGIKDMPGVLDPFKKDALGLDFNQRSIASRAADSVADVVPASSSEAALQAIDEAASGSLMGTPQTTDFLSKYIKRPDLENVVPAFDLEASIKAFDEAASGKPQTTDSLSKYIKRPKEVGGYPVNEAMLKPEGVDPAKAATEAMKELAQSSENSRESWISDLYSKLGGPDLETIKQDGIDYLKNAIMGGEEEYEEQSGGSYIQTSPVYAPPVPQVTPFSNAFQNSMGAGMVNTSYNGLQMMLRQSQAPYALPRV